MDREMPSSTRLEDIHTKLKELEGSDVHIKADMGRSRVLERTGNLVQVHPALFVIEIKERRGRIARQSFKYVDILMGTVQLFDNNTGEPLFNIVVE